MAEDIRRVIEQCDKCQNMLDTLHTHTKTHYTEMSSQEEDTTTRSINFNYLELMFYYYPVKGTPTKTTTESAMTDKEVGDSNTGLVNLRVDHLEDHLSGGALYLIIILAAMGILYCCKRKGCCSAGPGISEWMEERRTRRELNQRRQSARALERMEDNLRTQMMIQYQRQPLPHRPNPMTEVEEPPMYPKLKMEKESALYASTLFALSREWDRA